jgi:hypothetical protein
MGRQHAKEFLPNNIAIGWREDVLEMYAGSIAVNDGLVAVHHVPHPETDPQFGLTRVEGLIVALGTAGLNHKQSRAVAGIESRSVTRHRSSALPKLGIEATNRQQVHWGKVVARAFQHGFYKVTNTASPVEGIGQEFNDLASFFANGFPINSYSYDGDSIDSSGYFDCSLHTLYRKVERYQNLLGIPPALNVGPLVVYAYCAGILTPGTIPDVPTREN